MASLLCISASKGLPDFAGSLAAAAQASALRTESWLSTIAGELQQIGQRDSVLAVAGIGIAAEVKGTVQTTLISTTSKTVGFGYR